MKTTKPIDIVLLGQELTAAGVVHRGVGMRGTENPTRPTEVDLTTFDENGFWIDLPPEAAPVVAAHDATKKDRAATFETAEDTERLRIVNERAAEDPAFAALADLTLGKERY